MALPACPCGGRFLWRSGFEEPFVAICRCGLSADEYLRRLEVEALIVSLIALMSEAPVA